MKIYTSKYRNHWVSPYTIIEYVFFWKAWSRCGRARGIIEDVNFVDHPAWVDRAVVYIDPISRGLQWFLDLVHPRITYIKLDRWDTWSFDHTMAEIILPGLRQLQAAKHGAPMTDDEDVPEHLRSTNAEPKEHEWDTDSLHFERWDWILSEMIWAFSQKVDPDADEQFFDHSAYQHNRVGIDEWQEDIKNGTSKTTYDRAGHEAWQERKANGFRLFGKYYESLWD